MLYFALHNDCPVVWISSADFVQSDGEQQGRGTTVVDVRLLFSCGYVPFKAEIYDGSATRVMCDLTDALAVQPHRLSVHVGGGAGHVHIEDMLFGSQGNILLRFECLQASAMVHVTWHDHP